MSLLTTESLSHMPFNVNKCEITNTLLPHGAAEVSFQSVQRTMCLSFKICYQQENMPPVVFCYTHLSAQESAKRK